MSRISLDMYYVGHGAMFYAEIFNNSNELEMKLLVDAGSNSDVTEVVAEQSEKEVIGRIMDNSASLIVCITHLHTDHYSYIRDLFYELNAAEQFEMLEAFYVGSMRFGSEEVNLFQYADVFRNIAFLLLDQNKQAWRHLGVIEEETELWHSADGEVRLTVLFNLLTGGGDENDNSAVFCLKHERVKQMVMFTGDITGWTLSNICFCKYYRDAFIKAVKSYSVWMTVPHHGSIHTLEKCGFIFWGEVRRDKLYISEQLDYLFYQAGLMAMGFFISAGMQDEFGHPDCFVTNMFYPYAKQIPGLLEHFPCYRTYDNPGYFMPRNLPPMDGGWFVFTNQRRMYTTVFAVNTGDPDAPWKLETRTIHQDFP